MITPDDLDPADFPILLVRARAEPEAVRRLILGFREQYGSIIADLRREVSRGETDEAVRLARSLRSVAGMLGATRLSEAAGQLEALLRTGEMRDASDSIIHLDRALCPILTTASNLDRRELKETRPRDPGALASCTSLDQNCVLVVDDASSMRELLEDVLKDDYKVLLAADGESGLRLAAEERPDLILLDVDLPDIDGHELLVRLIRREATQSIPVIFVTGMIDVASETMGLSLGAVDYVVKPISPAILLARVKSQIKLKRAETEARSRASREHYIEMVTEFERAALLEETRQIQLKTKDNFLSHVSHELRAPAASILAFSTLIMDGLAGEVNAQQTEYLGIVVKNVEHLQAMIEDLLEATRLGSGKLSIQTDDIFAAEEVEYAVNTVSRSARRKSLHVVSQIPAQLPSCRAGATRLRQILTILLDNAVKFTPAGGSITVGARVFEQDPSFLLLEVADTGCGIAKEKLGSVFNRLYQCAGPDDRGRGLALGLHIAQKLFHRRLNPGSAYISSSLVRLLIRQMLCGCSFEERQQDDRLIVLRILCSIDQGHRGVFISCLGDANNRIFCFCCRQFGFVACTEFKPPRRIMSEPLPEFRTGGDIFCPQIQTQVGFLLPPRPQPIYKDAKAISAVRLLIRPLEQNLHSGNHPY